MTADLTRPSIRTATDGDIGAIYELARSALSLDSFSMALLAEKLFNNPRPAEMDCNVMIAEAAGQPVGFMQSVQRPAVAKGWLGLFAVRAELRRRGVATAMLQRAKEGWQRAGLKEVEALAIPGNYFAPGLDPRYTEAVCFLERCGFERFRDCVNLTTDLSQAFDTAAEEQRVRAADIEIRRARSTDGPLLDKYFQNHFGADWRFEVSLAMRNDPPSLHLAIKEGRIIAFSAHSTQNGEWGFFGPMGTAPEARGHGLGRVLLWHCLNDMRAAGHRTSVIPWVGPIAFYQQWAGSRVERVFWRYRLLFEATGH